MADRYTDTQLALILKRAAELQASGEEPTHSLASIQQLGEQVGIDGDLIARAAESLPADPQSGFSLSGTSSAYRTSRRVPVAISTVDHGRLAALIRDHMTGLGELRPVGEGFEWHSGASDNKTLIAVAPAGDHTRVRVDLRQHGQKAALYLGAGLLTMVAGVAGVIASPVIGGAMFVGMGVGSFIAARTAWDRIAARNRRRVESLLDEINDIVDR